MKKTKLAAAALVSLVYSQELAAASLYEDGLLKYELDYPNYLTLGNQPVDKLFFLKGDKFILNHVSSGFLSSDNVVIFKAVVQTGTRVSFDLISVAQKDYIIKSTGFGPDSDMGLKGKDSYNIRGRGDFDFFFEDNGKFCSNEPNCLFETSFDGFVTGYGDGKRSSTYLVRVSDINEPLSPIPLPASLSFLLGGLGLFGLMSWRKKDKQV